MPGYGYTCLSKKEKKNIDNLITEYFLFRKQIRLIFLIIDIRHNPLEIDLNFMSWLIDQGKKFSIIFSKCDKLKKKEVNAQDYMLEVKNKLNKKPKYFITSSKKKEGVKEVLNHIESLNVL